MFLSKHVVLCFGLEKNYVTVKYFPMENEARIYFNALPSDLSKQLLSIQSNELDIWAEIMEQKSPSPSFMQRMGGREDFINTFRFFHKDCYRKLQRIVKSLTSVTVLNMNIRFKTTADKGETNWIQRRKRVFKEINDIHPDVFGLQEVLEDQLQYLRKKFPDYGCVSFGRVNGVTSGEACPIFYDKHVFKLNNFGVFWLDEVSVRKTNNELHPRICTFAYLETFNGISILVLNLHAGLSSSRGAQFKTVFNFLKKASTPNIIIMGDFNENIRDKHSSWKSDKLGIYNVRKNEKPEQTYFRNFKLDSHGGEYDHILSSRSLPVREVSVGKFNEQYPLSDHVPIIAKFSLMWT
jgi:endonuclease/exonuclease/phosphatase family metal-dependent hydrolase